MSYLLLVLSLFWLLLLIEFYLTRRLSRHNLFLQTTRYNPKSGPEEDLAARFKREPQFCFQMLKRHSVRQSVFVKFKKLQC